MDNREGASHEGGIDLHTRRRIKGRSNIVALQYPSGGTQEKVEDNGIGHKKLLVTRSNEGSGKIHRWV